MNEDSTKTKKLKLQYKLEVTAKLVAFQAGTILSPTVQFTQQFFYPNVFFADPMYDLSFFSHPLFQELLTLP